MNQLSRRGPYSHCLERDEIRLFKLAIPPSGRDATAQLKGRVEVFKVEDGKPHYRALSYRWGTRNAGTDPHIRLSNGSESQSISIPKNLYDYLITLKAKKTDESPWMWIDSICINQHEDPEAFQERGRQVACMDRTYASADTVTIWLGASAYRDAEEFTNPVRWLHKYLKVDPKLFDVPWMPEHLNEICQNPYWLRLWIIQEICKARSLKQVKVRMGSFEISGSQLLQLLQKHPADDRSDAPLKLLTDRDEPKSLPELMERYRTWKCSWQRDTVFALLALARRESKEGLLRIPVDYDLPWDVLHHELIRADANRMHKIFRFSEFLHRRFRSFKKPWDPKDSNLDEEQKKETCDLTGFYVGCVQNTVSMFCNTNKELDEYVRKGLNGMDIDHVGIKRELQSFHQDVQGIQLKTFTGARADTFIFTRDPEFKDTLHRCWNIRNLPQVDETSRHSSQEAEGNRTARGLQPQEVPRSPQHSSPVTLNVNIRHVGPQSQNLERITRNAVASPNQPLETRQWFRIEHSKPQNNALCACTGATYGQSLRKGDLVFQFEDSEFAVLARPRSNEAEDDDWTPYRIIGRAVIARDCCHRPEASKREVDNTSFSFRAIDPDNTKMFPIALFRMTISSLVELTRLIESVKGN